MVESTKEIPTGNACSSAAFVREGDAMPTTGTLTLYVNDEKVGEGTDHDAARQLLAGRRGLERRPRPGGAGHRRTTRATSPYAFTGGTIKQVIVDVSGEPFVDLEKEALALMKRE